MSEYGGLSIIYDPTMPPDLIFLGPVPQLADGSVNWAQFCRDAHEALCSGVLLPYAVVRIP